MTFADDEAPARRRFILATLVVGLLGAAAELLLLGHYENGFQLIPLFLIGFALAVLGWHGRRPSVASVRLLQATMVLFLVSGLVGVLLHFRGGAHFQWELDPSMRFGDVFKKVMRVKDPPVLAPGLMVHLGLIGLIYGHGHPALTGVISPTTE